MKKSVPNRIFYKNEPIRSLNALEKALNVHQAYLLEVSACASGLYRRPKTRTKKSDGTLRDTWSVREPLRGIQDAILKNIISGVAFPAYITGSIKGGDYKANAKPHAGAAIVITEDIADFFPSATEESIFQIWKNVFGFSSDVCRCLAALTTKDGLIPQGAPTSSYLANMIFWKYEPVFHGWVEANRFVYTRYVDDISVSSRAPISAADKTKIVSTIHQLVNRVDMRLKREKHQISTQSAQMIVTKLHVNGHAPTLSQSERSRIRAAVLQCELRAKEIPLSPDLNKRIESAAGRVGKLGRFHEKEAIRLMARLKAVRRSLGQ